MNKLTEKQMIEIIDNKQIDKCSPEQKEQILDYAFGPLFVCSEDKGEACDYDDLDEMTNLANDLYS